ncbi:MAG: exodeoxyribonuclease III [Puniceicoccales bacterium]|jgi:exodeoxyribonuclease-3|nr:exodeoxyribonuclease III [Puniceicoccales bacterium]
MTSASLKLHSWNVNGFRSVRAKTFDAYLDAHAPDILCLQEIKLSAATLPAPPQPSLFDAADAAATGTTTGGGDFSAGSTGNVADGALVSGYPHQFWHIADKPGYSGTAVLSRVRPLSVTHDFTDTAAGGDTVEHPREGRVLNVEFAHCFVVCAYVPNAQDGLTRLDYRLAWDAAFRRHLAALSARKPVFVCGDLNVAHCEIDLANPARNRRNPGFTDEERESFGTLLAQGFADTFREKNPGVAERYSWWSYRAAARERNVGWRIDYWLAPRALDGQWSAPEILDNVLGSDHCPVSLRVERALF